MKKFWEWMLKKEYARDEFGEYVLAGSKGYYMDDKPTKQMLIGYFVEYIIENDKENSPWETVYDTYKEMSENL